MRRRSRWFIETHGTEARSSPPISRFAHLIFHPGGRISEFLGPPNGRPRKTNHHPSCSAWPDRAWRGFVVREAILRLMPARRPDPQPPRLRRRRQTSSTGTMTVGAKFLVFMRSVVYSRGIAKRNSVAQTVPSSADRECRQTSKGHAEQSALCLPWRARRRRNF